MFLLWSLVLLKAGIERKDSVGMHGLRHGKVVSSFPPKEPPLMPEELPVLSVVGCSTLE